MQVTFEQYRFAFASKQLDTGVYLKCYKRCDNNFFVRENTLFVLDFSRY